MPQAIPIIIGYVASMLTTVGIYGMTAYYLATALVYSALLSTINAGIKAMQPRKKGGRGYGLELNYAGTAEPRRLIYGFQRVGGMHVIPGICTGNKGEYLHAVIALCGHEVDDIQTVWFDQTQLMGIGSVTGSDNDGVVSSGKYADRAWIRRYKGTSTQTADYILTHAAAAFTADFRGRGIAYMAIRLKYDTKVYETGLPLFMANVKGKKLYDPRLDTTKGGSGSHLDNDSTTWTYSNNPALCVRDFLVNEVGFANEDIDDTLVASAADICDAQVALPSGTQERYTCNVTLFASTPWVDNLKTLVDSMFGRVVYRDGKWRIYAGAWETPSLSITKDDWVSPTVVKISVDRDERWNAVRANFVDPSRNWQMSECYPRRNASYETDDGGERIWRELELNATTNQYQAQRIAELTLRMGRNQIRMSGRLRPQFIQLSTWDTVYVTDDEYGWSSKTFRVLGMEMAADGSVDVSLIEDGSATYADMAAGDYSAEPTYDTLDPGATLPSVAGTLIATPKAGAIDFAWSEAAEGTLAGQTYRVLESVNCYDPGSASEVWRGLGFNATVAKSDVTTRWYWVQGQVGSYYSEYSPSSWGLGAAANSPPADGTPGTYAPNLYLTSDGQAFRFSGSGTSLGVNTINFDIELTALPGATAVVYAQNYRADGTALNSYNLTGTGNSNRGLCINSFSQAGSTAYATVVASVTGGYYDRVTVMRLQDGTSGSSGTPGGDAHGAVLNGGFETGTFLGWTQVTSATIKTTSMHAGSYCAILPSATGGPNLMSQAIPAEVGQTWYAAAYAHPDMGVNTPDFACQLAVRQYTAADAQIARTVLGTADISSFSWQKLAGTLVMPASTAYIKLDLGEAAGNSGYWMLDDAFATIVGSAGAPGSYGPALFTINSRSTYEVGPNWILATSKAAGYNVGPSTLERYRGGAFVSYRTPTDCNSARRFMALAVTSDTNAYNTLEYALLLYTGGNAVVYEVGSLRGTIATGCVSGDQFAILYDNQNVYYTRNGSTHLTTPSSPGLALIMRSSFADSGGYIDQIAFGPMGAKGYDPIVGFLSNEVHALVASYNGYIPSYTGASGKMFLFEGTNSVHVNSITFASSAVSPVGMTVTNSTNGAYAVTGGIGVSDDNGIANIRGTYKSTAIDKTFTVVKAKAGVPGDVGSQGLPGNDGDFNPYMGGDATFQRQSMVQSNGQLFGSYWHAKANNNGSPYAYTNVHSMGIIGSGGLIGGYFQWSWANTATSTLLWPIANAQQLKRLELIDGALLDVRMRWRVTSFFTMASNLNPLVLQVMVTNSVAADVSTIQYGEYVLSNRAPQVTGPRYGATPVMMSSYFDAASGGVWQETQYTFNVTQPYSSATFKYLTAGLLLQSNSTASGKGQIQIDMLDFQLRAKGTAPQAPQKTSSGAHLATPSDAGGHLKTTTGGVTVNAGTFIEGDLISYYNHSGSTQTLTAGAGVTFRLAGGTTTGSPRTIAIYGIVTLLCIGADDFLLTGNVT